MTPIEKGNTHGPDPLYSAALCPLLPEASLDAIVVGVARAAAVDGPAFAEFLQQQKLTPLWDRMLELNPVPAGLLTRDVRDSLSRARVSATEAYVVQQQGLRLSRDILDAAGIAHVVYRGADARERYYAEPSLRPVNRIRLLVSDSSKVEAIKAFGQWGFELQAARHSVSHRASLSRSKVSIGLQWDLMRPGHTRLPMT